MYLPTLKLDYFLEREKGNTINLHGTTTKEKQKKKIHLNENESKHKRKVERKY